MSATQFDEGRRPAGRSRNTLVIVIGLVSLTLVIGGVLAVLLLGGDKDEKDVPGAVVTELDRKPVEPGQPGEKPGPQAPTQPVEQPQPVPPPEPQPPQEPVSQGVANPDRVCSDDPSLPVPQIEDSDGSRIEAYDTTDDGKHDVAIVSDETGAELVVVDRNQADAWDEMGMCEAGAYVPFG